MRFDVSARARVIPLDVGHRECCGTPREYSSNSRNHRQFTGDGWSARYVRSRARHFGALRFVSARGNGRNAKITMSSARYGGRDRVRPCARTGSDIISIRSFVSVVSRARDRFRVARARARLCGKRLDRNYIGLSRAALIRPVAFTRQGFYCAVVTYDTYRAA